ncbi:MAG: hypothetical protein AAGJ86_13665 [Pseudomonadota bacterium]
MTALLWAARKYLSHAISGEPAPPVLRLLFRQVLPADVEPELVRTLDFLIYHSTVPLVVKERRSAGFAAHEQALAEAIRAVQAGSLETYCTAMEQVLVAEDAIMIGPSIQSIAFAMQRLEHDGFVQSASISMPFRFVGPGRLVSVH